MRLLGATLVLGVTVALLACSGAEQESPHAIEQGQAQDDGDQVTESPEPQAEDADEPGDGTAKAIEQGQAQDGSDPVEESPEPQAADADEPGDGTAFFCDFPFTVEVPRDLDPFTEVPTDLLPGYSFDVSVVPRCKASVTSPQGPADTVEFRFLEDAKVRVSKPLKDAPVGESGERHASVIIEYQGEWQLFVHADGREFPGPIYFVGFAPSRNPPQFRNPADDPDWAHEAVALPVRPAVIPAGMRVVAELSCVQCDNAWGWLYSFPDIDGSCTLLCIGRGGIGVPTGLRTDKFHPPLVSPNATVIAFPLCISACYRELPTADPALSIVMLSEDGGVRWQELDLPDGFWTVESVSDDASAILRERGRRFAYPGLSPLADLAGEAKNVEVLTDQGLLFRQPIFVGVTHDASVISFGRHKVARDGEIIVDLGVDSIVDVAIEPGSGLLAVAVGNLARDRLFPSPFLLVYDTSGALLGSYTLDLPQARAYWQFRHLRWDEHGRIWADLGMQGLLVRTLVIDRETGEALSYSPLGSDGRITASPWATVITIGPGPLPSTGLVSVDPSSCLNLRFSPRLAGVIFRCLPDATPLALTGESAVDASGRLWLFARAGGDFGWLAADFVE